MPFFFARIPCGQTRRAQDIKKYTDSVSSKTLAQLQRDRSVCVDNVLSIQRAIDKNAKNRSTSGVGMAEERAKILAKLTESVNAYCADMIKLVSENHVAAYMCFYSWSNPLLDAMNVMVNDYRYDMFNMYFSIGVSFLSMSSLVATCDAFCPTAQDALEKEAYHALLQAAGYFDLSANILQALRQKPNAAMVVNGGETATFNVLHVIASLLSNLALAQAQEIGIARAYRADPADNSDLTAALAHQCVTLYDSAMSLMRNTVLTTNPVYDRLQELIAAKFHNYDMLLHIHAAAFMFRTAPQRGLSALALAENKSHIVSTILKTSTKSSSKLPVGCNAVLKESISIFDKKKPV